MAEQHTEDSRAQSTPRVAIRTVGCRLNQAESAQIAGAFQAAGYRVVPPSDPCEVFVLHSCTITGKAESDSCRLTRQATRRTPRPVVVLIGCAVEAGGEAVADRSHADVVIGQQNKFDLPALLAERYGFPAAPSDTCRAAHPLFTSTRAIVRVQDGCHFGCSYCIVPHTRRHLWSRPLPDIVHEAQHLEERGFKEIVLTGANLGCYRTAQAGLVDMIAALLSETGLPRIRLSSIESTTISDPLIEMMSANPRICRALHIPLQSGSDAVLARMRRRYHRAQFQSMIERIATALPRIGIGTDIITGFPGETDDDFRLTRRLIESLPFSNLHVFPFSPRPGTDAASLPGPVAPAVARDRAQTLIALGERKRDLFAAQFIGRTVALLVEKVNTNGGTGWTCEYLPARVAGPVQTDTITRFQPTAWRNGRLC